MGAEEHVVHLKQRIETSSSQRWWSNIRTYLHLKQRIETYDFSDRAVGAPVGISNRELKHGRHVAAWAVETIESISNRELKHIPTTS